MMHRESQGDRSWSACSIGLYNFYEWWLLSDGNLLRIEKVRTLFRAALVFKLLSFRATFYCPGGYFGSSLYRFIWEGSASVRTRKALGNTFLLCG
jgi:hypothetical protein